MANRTLRSTEKHMIALTRKSDYALIALSHLARCPDGLSSARGIADAYRVSLPLLMNILKLLTKTGVVESVRGARGGYRLAARANEMSLKELIVALEGPIRLVQCAEATDDEVTCQQMRWCPVQGPARRVHDRLDHFLSQVSLTEIIGEPNLEDAPFEQSVEDTINEPSVSG
jgi:Rrf2 family protein